MLDSGCDDWSNGVGGVELGLKLDRLFVSIGKFCCEQCGAFSLFYQTERQREREFHLIRATYMLMYILDLEAATDW